MTDPTPARPGPTQAVIACAALHRELRGVLGQFGDAVRVELLPANLHNRPEQITPAVAEQIRQLRSEGIDQIAVAYADCGTGGALDRLLDAEGVRRLPGAHCYAVFTGVDVFESVQADELGTFYLTDFLALHFDSLVWSGLGLDRHPALRDVYFRHYTRLVWLSQTENSVTEQKALAAAQLLGLRYDRRHTGLAPFASALHEVLRPLDRHGPSTPA